MVAKERHPPTKRRYRLTASGAGRSAIKVREAARCFPSSSSAAESARQIKCRGKSGVGKCDQPHKEDALVLLYCRGNPSDPRVSGRHVDGSGEGQLDASVCPQVCRNTITRKVEQVVLWTNPTGRRADVKNGLFFLEATVSFY